jgi:hypothetical protein
MADLPAISGDPKMNIHESGPVSILKTRAVQEINAYRTRSARYANFYIFGLLSGIILN